MNIYLNVSLIYKIKVAKMKVVVRIVVLRMVSRVVVDIVLRVWTVIRKVVKIMVDRVEGRTIQETI